MALMPSRGKAAAPRQKAPQTSSKIQQGVLNSVSKNTLLKNGLKKCVIMASEK
jgi:hypothetical protein